ncbi:MAG: hypothetical protein ACHQZR_00270 [Candidatus Limnocylindrales bacterium]
MPSFKLFNRDSQAPAPEATPGEPVVPATAALHEGVPFDALTEEWRLVGVMRVKGRLSDTLNKRETIPISDVSWAPSDGSAPFTPAPGLQAVDPYDLVVVLGGKDSLPVQSEEERSAHRIHKVDYDVALECPPFRIVGTVHLFPGTDPARLLDRTTELFIPVTGAQAFYGAQPVGDAHIDVALVNRSYLRGVQQLDDGSTAQDGRSRAADAAPAAEVTPEAEAS